MFLRRRVVQKYDGIRRGVLPTTRLQRTPWWYLRSPSVLNFPDQQPFSALRFDKLEWGGPNTGASARWDMEAFVGTDYDKLFFKSEGFYSGKTRTTEEGQFQVLYSRLISYYFDAQLDVRQDFSKKSHRTYAVIGSGFHRDRRGCLHQPEGRAFCFDYCVP